MSTGSSPSALGWLLLGLLGCSAETTAPLPVDTDSVLVLVVPGSSPPKAFAAEPSGSPVEMELDPADAEESQLYALALDRPLGSLGLKAGWVATTADGRRPAHTGILEASVRAGEISAWTVNTELPENADRIGVVTSRPDPCVALDVERFDLAVSRHAHFALSVDDDVLAGTADGLLRITRDSVEKLPAELPSLAGAIDPDSEELWLVGADGKVVRGRLPDQLVDTGHPAAANALDHASITVAGGFAYLVSSAGPLERFDGTAWSTLGQIDDGDSPERFVVALDEGGVLAMRRGGIKVSAFENGRREERVVIDEVLSQIALEKLYTLVRLPELGILALGFFGYLFHTQDALSFQSSNERLVQLLSAAAPIAGGVLFAGQNGVVIQWQNGASCRPGTITVSGNIGSAARLGNGVVVLEENPAAGKPIRGARIYPR